MEEPAYEYDWRHPIEVPNPKNKSGKSVENGSFKWFEYWLKHGCTYKQIADYFNTSESSVGVIASLFKWKERRRNKEDYETRQREKIQLEKYQQFIDADYKNADTQLKALYKLSQIALIFLGVLPNKTGMEIPQDMDANKAIKILQGNPQAINKMHTQILRDLEKPGNINDKLTHNIHGEMDLNQTITNADNTASIDDLFELYKEDEEESMNGNDTK